MSIDPTRYVVGPDATIEDIDLDEEEVWLADGTRLTEDVAEQFRVPESLRAAAEAKAAAQGVSLSVLAREALEHYLAS